LEKVSYHITELDQENHLITCDAYPPTSTTRTNPIRKFIDYITVFIEVNEELIESDKEKKKRNKKTSRYPITKEFIEATELMK